MADKRIATNSMLGTAKRCRKKLLYEYGEEIQPTRRSAALSFGSLFHLLIRDLLANEEDATFEAVAEQWRAGKLERAAQHTAQVKAQFGIEDAGILTAAEAQCDDIATKATDLIRHYRDSVWAEERDRFDYIWFEQRFAVPLTTRDDKRHPVWRYDGKWDILLRDRANGRTKVRDFKTTVRQPADFATMMELDTQPIGYLYAATWLSIVDRPECTLREWRKADVSKLDAAIAPDFPYWPTDLPTPSAFEVEVIRKKVPKEPPLLKRGHLSKAQNVDTTPELYRAAIDRHGLDPADYADVLDRLARRGNAFHFRNEVNVGGAEIRRWAEETRNVLQDLSMLMRHPERAYRADSMTCQNQYGRRCVFHPLCYGDEEMARADFVHVPRHSELEDEEEVNGG
jgi:hypothetical protein